MKGIDYGYGNVKGSTIKAAGYEFVCRYLSYSTGKNLTWSELQDFRNHELGIVLVWETTENRSLQGFEIGQSDGKKALDEAQQLGIKHPNCIYFACDNDFSLLQCKIIAEYFKGIQSTISIDHLGVYGGYTVVKYLMDMKLVHYGWQTSAWSNGRWEERAQLRQISYNEKLDGVQCDVNEATSIDFGQL